MVLVLVKQHPGRQCLHTAQRFTQYRNHFQAAGGMQPLFSGGRVSKHMDTSCLLPAGLTDGEGALAPFVWPCTEGDNSQQTIIWGADVVS